MGTLSDGFTYLRGLWHSRTPSAPAVNLGRVFLDTVFAHRCVGCGREGVLLCDICLGMARRLDLPYRPSSAAGPNACLTPSSSLEGVLGCFAMEGAIREAVHSLKYGGVRVLAPIMGRRMAVRLRASGLVFDAVIPVPLHPNRLRERGFNQAHLLGLEIAEEVGLPLRADLLRRVRHGQALARAPSLEDRRAAVRRAFEADVRVDGLRLLLVDDVCTTGATLDACSEPLVAAGALSVWGLTFARAI